MVADHHHGQVKFENQGPWVIVTKANGLFRLLDIKLFCCDQLMVLI